MPGEGGSEGIRVEDIGCAVVISAPVGGKIGDEVAGASVGAKVSARCCETKVIDDRLGINARKLSLHKSDSSMLFTQVSVSMGSYMIVPSLTTLKPPDIAILFCVVQFE